MKAMATVTVTKREESLLQIYPGQSEPQGCYIELDVRTGELCADWNGESGNAVPAAVYHGIVRRYAIPPLRVSIVNALLDEVAPFAGVVVNGTAIEWNGANHVAVLSDQAEEAEVEIERMCGDADDDEVEQYADAGDWLYHARDTLAGRLASGESVDSLVAELDGDGTDDQPILVGLRPWLERLAERV